MDSFHTSVDELVQPVSEGIYSNGNFYWINGVDHGRESFTVFSSDVKECKQKKIKGQGPFMVSIKQQ
jgi:hypothetical protein